MTGEGWLAVLMLFAVVTVLSLLPEIGRRLHWWHHWHHTDEPPRVVPEGRPWGCRSTEPRVRREYPEQCCRCPATRWWRAI